MAYDVATLLTNALRALKTFFFFFITSLSLFIYGSLSRGHGAKTNYIFLIIRSFRLKYVLLTRPVIAYKLMLPTVTTLYVMLCVAF